MTDSSAENERQLWLIPEQGAAREGLVAQVAVRLPAHRLFACAVPDELNATLAPGTPVRVRLSRSGRLVDGWCVSIGRVVLRHTLDPIVQVIPDAPPMPRGLIDLGCWVAEYYAHAPGATFAALVPEGVSARPTRTCAFLVRASDQAPAGLTRKQQALLDQVPPGGVARELALRQAGVGAGVLNALRSAGCVRVERRRIVTPMPAAPSEAPATPDPTPEDEFALTPAQDAAVQRISGASDARDFRAFLLFGPPGSGKTEVYVRTIRHVVAQRRQALLLLPEIALATQIVQRLERRFARVAVLHSNQTDSHRRAEWSRIAAGQADLVIGTRSAVFAPLPAAGLILVDEEQESSYKNLRAPYYHARDVAVKRAQLERIPIVLGSATPSLETWHNASSNAHFTRLDLPTRVPGAELPQVRVVDSRRSMLGDTGGLLRAETLDALRATLAADRQAVLLHNRRGYSALLRCPVCGLTLRCERCGTHYVEHRAASLLKCHRCGNRRPLTRTCPDASCGAPLESGVLAIQRLEEELRRAAPAARIERLDRDTMSGRADYAGALERVRSRAADVLLGTQMIAKGLDFPEVGLVAVIDPDEMLAMPDFRAAERVVQLLVQVIGRAGRAGGDSLAMIQTRSPDSRVARAARELNYAEFARDELEVRKSGFDPPWSRLARIVVWDERESRCRKAAEDIAAALAAIAARHDARARVSDATPCFLGRVRGKRRYHVLLRVPRDTTPAPILREARARRVFTCKADRISVDVDPVDML